MPVNSLRMDHMALSGGLIKLGSGVGGTCWEEDGLITSGIQQEHHKHPLQQRGVFLFFSRLR